MTDTMPDQAPDARGLTIERLYELICDIGDAAAALTGAAGCIRTRLDIPAAGNLELLTERQWRLLAQALDDATQHRLARIPVHCAACDASPSNGCPACTGHWERIDGYHELAAQLGATLPIARRLRPVPSGAA